MDCSAFKVVVSSLSVRVGGSKHKELTSSMGRVRPAFCASLVRCGKSVSTESKSSYWEAKRFGFWWPKITGLCPKLKIA